MASSNDDDKTQIKPQAPQGDDKTRITPRKPEALSAEERARIEEQRKREAAQKARELEQRLAAIAARKKQLAAEEAGTEGDDRTRFQPRGDANTGEQSDKTQFQPRAKPTSSVAGEESNEDKTQFQPRGNPTSSTPSLENETNNADKTQFKPRPQKTTQAEQGSESDKTQFQPPKAADDQTRIPSKPLESAPSESAEGSIPSDSTVFKPAVPNPDKTVVSATEAPPGAPLRKPCIDFFRTHFRWPRAT